MDYKSTLNLPKTDFSMKADLPKREPLCLDKWQKEGLYGKILKNRAGKKKYVLHDGPPYSNGDIHIGHALNKILKDIIVKYQTMKGHLCYYVPGWDCHGLPVEHALFKELGIKHKTDINQVDFRKEAFKYAMRYVNIQREQFKRLGVLADWDNPYLTIDKGYEADIIRAFGKLAEKGYIYKGLKPVNWCYVCETALAEAEVEYEDYISPSVYVKFRIDKFKEREWERDHYFVIWTTTPWTLIANVAVAVHPDYEYAFVENNSSGRKETWIMMNSLVKSAMEKFGIKYYTVVKKISGKELEGITCRHPFIDRESKVVLAGYVSNLEGTGCVHTAPGHGQEDYQTGIKYKLPVIMPVDTRGRFDKTCGEFSGMNVRDANKPIIEKMRNNSALILSSDVSHSYPHCWRCKTPIIFRATPQWFLKVDHNNLRKEMLATIAKKIKWVPPSGKERISSMVEGRPDWCLSRQRLWGVPIAAFYCKDCGAELLDAAVIRHIADIIEKEGADAWFIKKEEELLPKNTACGKCGKKEFKKETDIIDVWFDSGISHQAVLKRRKDLDYPADLYLEGSDQHRGWFQSALITSMGIENAPAFKTVLTHGFVVDGEGKKMSKSLGNTVSPQDVIKDYGADILRLWVASSDYSEDIRISPQIVTRLADAYRKIRNTCRFILGNISDFDPKKDAVKRTEMLEIDRWALSETYKLVDEVTRFYDEFSFHNVFHCVYDFCVIQMSSFYLDILKDRMYIAGTKSLQRRSGQTALFEILNVITKVMAPILVFTADESWKSLHRSDSESVHLSDWPELNSGLLKDAYDKGLEEKWAAIIKVRQDVLKALELKREKGIIGSSLEARLRIKSPDKALEKLLKEKLGILPFIFIVSGVEISSGEFVDAVKGEEAAPLEIEVLKASGAKCQRCWNYSEYVGKDSEHPSLCERCVNIVKGDR